MFIKALVIATFLLSSIGYASTWMIDPDHASAEFKVRHLMVSNVTGAFSTVAGKVEWDDKDTTKSKVSAQIKTDTINTRNEKRDDHLKSPDFFDVKKFPAMKFESTSITKKAGSKLAMTGNLTIKDVTKTVTFEVETTEPVKNPWGKTVRGATATTRINREDFNIKWNKALETGGVVVGKDVDITLNIELIKDETKKAS